MNGVFNNIHGIIHVFAPGCTEIEVSNTALSQQSEREGLYIISSSETCDSKPVYIMQGLSTEYLFSFNGYWVISDENCVNVGGIAVQSSASSPDRVTARWRETDGEGWMESDVIIRCSK